MNPSRVLFLVALGVLTAVSASAQRPNLRHYTMQDGLAQSQALTVFQDSTGYLWIGSYGGVARYDGSRFTTFSSVDGLRSNTVQSLAEGADGRLVVGTVGGGLCFIGESDDGPAPRVECPAGLDLERANVHSIVVDDTGAIWAATDSGVLRVDGDRVRRFGSLDGLPAERCRAIGIHDGSLLVGTDGGLARWADGRFVPIDAAPFDEAAVDALVVDGRRLLVAGAAGIFGWSDGAATAIPFPEPLRQGRVLDMAVDRRGGLWLATSAGLGYWFEDSMTTIGTEQGLPIDVVHAVTVDHEETVWLATDRGLSKLVPGPFSTFSTSEGLPNGVARALAEDIDGRIWVGTRDGVARQVGDRFEAVAGLDFSDPRIYALAATSDGAMWVGGRGGLAWLSPAVVDGEAGTIERFSEDDGLPSRYVTSLIAEDDGGLWVATDHGIVYRGTDGVFRPFEHPRLRDAYVIATERGPDGRVWFAMQFGGVMAVRARRDGPGMRLEQLESWGSAQGLTDLTIWDLDHDRDGVLWIGSNGEGLFSLAPDGNIRQYTTAAGLVDLFVWEVVVDADDAVWAYTNRGLDRFDGERFEHFDESEGLPDPEGVATAALRCTEGHLWFGTPEGVVRYNATGFVRNTLPPRVLIQEAWVDDRQVESGVELAASSAPLTFRFAALSFREESKVRFRHRLAGPNGSGVWSAPRADATLTVVGLAPGRYRLEVEARNEAGFWSKTPDHFVFVVRSHPWQSPWLRGALALILVGLLWAGTRVRTHRLVDDRRRLEALVADRNAELARQHASLEREIEERAEIERTQQRLEERLRQSEKMEAVGRLAGGVAHDFNNLLTTISGYGDLLRDQLAIDDPRREEVDEILGAAERAARLTQQLLAFSRKQVIEPRILHLNEVVRDISRMLGRLIGEHVTLASELRARADTVRCDRGQLEQVLVNLAVNARDSMTGGGRLEICTESELLRVPRTVHQGQEIPPGAWVVLRVSDTGHGMSADIVERIFEPFFTTKEKGKGTGLGLSTVYGIVRQNDGTIDVTSTPGEGTTFEIRLPLVDEQPPDIQASGILTMPLLDDVVTVLVVEDEESVRRLISGVLRRYGYDVLEAGSGLEAFQIARRHPGEIELLLTDVVMPEHDGKAVAERLTAERPGLRVLYVSGYPDDFLNQRGILPGDNNFLNKPFTPKTLMKAVRRVLEEE